MTSAADFGLAGAAFHHPPMLTAAVETPRYRGISSAGFEPLHLKIKSLKLSARGGRSRTCASRVKLSCRPLAKESLRRCKFRTRRPAHICETSRYRAVFERPSYLTRLRRTDWLGRRDSNLCISKSDLLKLHPTSTGSRRRSIGRAFNSRCASSSPAPRAESIGKFRSTRLMTRE